jgi:hypothetical protein
MPRFFFDIHDGENFMPDRQGADLEDLEAAKDEAKKALPDLVRDARLDGDRRDVTVDGLCCTDRLVGVLSPPQAFA